MEMCVQIFTVLFCLEFYIFENCCLLLVVFNSVVKVEYIFETLHLELDSFKPKYCSPV